MEIMFEDLTPDAQQRLLKAAGVSRPEDMDWDELPVAVVDFVKNDYSLDGEYDEDEYRYGSNYASDDEEDYSPDLDEDEFYD